MFYNDYYDKLAPLMIDCFKSVFPSIEDDYIHDDSEDNIMEEAGDTISFFFNTFEFADLGIGVCAGFSIDENSAHATVFIDNNTSEDEQRDLIDKFFIPSLGDIWQAETGGSNIMLSLYISDYTSFEDVIDEVKQALIALKENQLCMLVLNKVI